MNEILNGIRLPAQLGGHICLDFANTVSPRRSEFPNELLPTYDHLLAWCWHTGLIEVAQAQRLFAAAHDFPTAAETALRAALEVRETIYHVFLTLIERETLENADLQPLNAILAQLQPYRRLEAHGAVCSWGWEDDIQHLERLVLPIVMAAADLLTSEQAQKVRQCPNCGWLFLDTSRNHTRRWCSMEFCGSQTKSRRQYERSRKKSASVDEALSSD